MIFVIGCCHFDDDSILPFRPFSSVEEMNATIEGNWRKAVSTDDLVYVLGDFAMKRPAYWQERLPGRKVLVLGNHDSFMSQDAGFLKTCESVVVRERYGRRIVTCWMSHFPYLSWPERSEGSIHLHAHCHGTVEQSLPGVPGPQRLDMSADVWEFTPVPLEVAAALAAERIKH